MSNIPSIRFLLVCFVCSIATDISHDVQSWFWQTFIGAVVFMSAYMVGRSDESKESNDAAE